MPETEPLSAPISPGGPTYAITHASAALILKRRYPRVGLWALLISVQLVELLWIIFSYLKIEHASITPDAVHLDFIPYSHSIGTAAFLAALAWGMGRSVHRSTVGAAIALGILSHVVLDIIHHEPNIALLPMTWGPRFGLNLQAYPILDFVVELAFCLVCWKLFDGSRGLLIGIVVFSLLDLPLMFPRQTTFAPLVSHPFMLQTVIMVDVIATAATVWWFGRERIFLEQAIPTEAR